MDFVHLNGSQTIRDFADPWSSVDQEPRRDSVVDSNRKMPNPSAENSKLSPSASFVTQQVNGSTFLIIEDDSYGEHPHIYVKCYPDYLVITDTGCDSPRPNKRSITSLREYIETVPVSANDNQPLNPNGKSYIIICSHCHYDHILGIPQFLETNPVIVVSAFDKSFLLSDFSKHSLCKYAHVPTPKYDISKWAGHLEYFSINQKPLRIQFLHIPGHTPDSLAWYDVDEHHLYVGDTFYERKREKAIPGIPDGAGQVPGLPATQAAIIFPDEGGSWIHFMSSLDLLHSFVLYRNLQLKRQFNSTDQSVPRVKVGCGHLTYDADAETMIIEVRDLFKKIIAGKIPVTSSGRKRGVIHDYWLESEGSRYSVMAPRRLVVEARKHFPLEV